MNKKKIIISLVSLFSIVACTTAIAFSNNNTIIQKQNITIKKFKVTIKGAVEYPNEYYFDNEIKIREILNLAKLKNNSDIRNIDLNRIINKDSVIFVPYKKNYRIHWSNLSSAFQLTELGINKTIAAKLVKFRSTHNKTTWEEINQIERIGKITLAKLQKVLML